jgi:ATP adenylyltransferase
MFCPDERLIITQLNNTHDLALNLFCVDRPQLLILTLDSYKRQHEALDADDFTVMLDTLARFPNFYVIFNCGEKGGCSRVHKHLQGIRGPPYAFDTLLSQTGKVPFQYFVHRFPGGFEAASAANVSAVYDDFMAKCRSLMQIDEQEACPHNVVMWKDHLIVIPRRQGSTQGASSNAGGMLGSVWVTSQEHVDEWLKVGCADVLRELGVPAERV